MRLEAFEGRFRLKKMELLQSGTTRREEKKERGNEWGWFSQMKTTLKRLIVLED